METTLWEQDNTKKLFCFITQLRFFDMLVIKVRATAAGYSKLASLAIKILVSDWTAIQLRKFDRLFMREADDTER